MTDYKQYNGLVHVVQVACEQKANGWHLSELDINNLKEAIKDLQSIVDTSGA